MSKLSIVREALRTNDDVIVVGSEERLYLPRPDGYWTHTVDFIVAPTGGLYTVEDLQAFMMGLVPLEVSCKDDFHGRDNYLYFGKLYFDETIGTEVVGGYRTISITDPDIELPDSFKNGEMTIDISQTIERKRRTWVRVYPDRTFAQRAAMNKEVFETRNFNPTRRSLRSIIKGQ